jgi:hypothetical protein
LLPIAAEFATTIDATVATRIGPEKAAYTFSDPRP